MTEVVSKSLSVRAEGNSVTLRLLDAHVRLTRDEAESLAKTLEHLAHVADLGWA